MNHGRKKKWWAESFRLWGWKGFKTWRKHALKIFGCTRRRAANRTHESLVPRRWPWCFPAAEAVPNCLVSSTKSIIGLNGVRWWWQGGQKTLTLDGKLLKRIKWPTVLHRYRAMERKEGGWQLFKNVDQPKGNTLVANPWLEAMEALRKVAGNSRHRELFSKTCVNFSNDLTGKMRRFMT